jgi:hypothetical protein
MRTLGYECQYTSESERTGQSQHGGIAEPSKTYAKLALTDRSSGAGPLADAVTLSPGPHALR